MEKKKGNMRYLNVKQCEHGPFALACMVTYFLMPFNFCLQHCHVYTTMSITTTTSLTHLDTTTPPLHHHHHHHHTCQLPPRHVHPPQQHHHNTFTTAPQQAINTTTHMKKAQTTGNCRLGQK